MGPYRRRACHAMTVAGRDVRGWCTAMLDGKRFQIQTIMDRNFFVIFEFIFAKSPRSSATTSKTVRATWVMPVTLSGVSTAPTDDDLRVRDGDVMAASWK